MTDTQVPAEDLSQSRTTVRRLPEKQVFSRDEAYAILDDGLVGSLGISVDGQPYVLPVAYARIKNRVVFHGSTGSRLFRHAATGAPLCMSVTLLDGLVAARSLFESSMHYRSVMVFGSASVLSGEEELEALLQLSEHLLPGRTVDARHPSKKERAGTMTLAIPIDEYSVKISSGDPADLPEDLVTPPYSDIWAGYVPLTMSPGTPVTDPHVPPRTPVPDYVQQWGRG